MTKKQVRIGINGFGRIGRNVFRAWYLETYKKHMDNGVEFVISAINDLGDPKHLEHLLKYDSLHKASLDVTFSKEDDTWQVIYNESKNNSETTALYSERDPSNIPWDKHNVDVVFDCTGIFRDKEGLSKHMRGSVKKVVLSAPGKDVDATFVMGVNDSEYDKDNHHIISNASCTTNCLAPVVKAMDDALTVKSGVMTTIHSYTADQRLLDADHSDLRRARAAALSIIPTSTGAAKAVGLVLPHLAGKLDGGAVRVPTPNVSLVDVVFHVEKETSTDDVKKILQDYVNKAFECSVLHLEDRPLVSTDFNGNSYSSIVDIELTKVMDKHTVKIISWYDNEVGYSNRMLNLASKLL